MATYQFQITGMNCASCVGRVEKALSVIPGVVTAQVNLATETAQVTGAKITLADLIAASASAGYPAAMDTITLDVQGLNCASCVGRVEKAALAIDGVTDAAVNLATGQAKITALAEAVTASHMARIISGAGYAANVIADDTAVPIEDRHDKAAHDLRRQTLQALVLTLPVFILAMGAHLIPGMHALIGQTIGHQADRIIQFVLTTAVLAGPGRLFFTLGVPALLRRLPDMNALVALGAGAAWLFSTLVTFWPALFPIGAAGVYFEAAAVIVTLILLGRWLEARAKGRTGEAIQKLVRLRPKTARVERGGDVTDIPCEAIIEGDIIHLRPGETVATDGIVVSGNTRIDESMMSGEPVPVAKREGDKVVGGTVNGTGALTFQATAVGSDTVLAQIIRMVGDAQGAKLPIQTLVDRITAVFVPVVLGLSALTIIVWLLIGPDPALSFALVAGVAVLIVACPCAMGLATPTSIMVGTGRAAELGVLFRRGDALQSLQEVDVVALDKTGTLTLGRPELTEFELVNDWDANTALPLIAAVEQSSEHPLATAIVGAAQARNLAIPTTQDFLSVTGMGVMGEVAEHKVAVGSAKLMAQERIDTQPFADRAAAFAQLGRTPIFAAIDGKVAALLAVSDPIRPTSAAAIAALQTQGLRVAMITGDTADTAQHVANALGIDQVIAGVLPDGKVAALQDLRKSGQRLAFVGDGINDAPALAAADVGIAIGTGTDIAIAAADVVLMRGDLGGVVDAFALSHAVMRNIRQNLFWAFAYNILLIPVAAGVLYPIAQIMLSPMLAAGAMALSSVFVLTNALRLRSFKSTHQQRDHLAPPITHGQEVLT